MGERKGVYSVWWENMMERDQWENTRVNERIIFKRIFRKWDVGV
jgi:hypothetical protein